MKAPIDFRMMGEKDLKAFSEIRNLSREWLHDTNEYSLKETTEWWHDNEENGEGPCYWVITYFGDVIGYFRVDIVDEYPMATTDDDIMIGADLHPTFRGKGIAKSLYPEFIRFLIRAFDFQNFYLRVKSHNIRAGKLYVSLGFKQIESPNDRDDILMLMTQEEFRDIYG